MGLLPQNPFSHQQGSFLRDPVQNGFNTLCDNLFLLNILYLVPIDEDIKDSIMAISPCQLSDTMQWKKISISPSRN